MHNLFLGELRHHCMEVFGVGVAEKGTRNAAWHTPEEQQQNLDRILAALKTRAKKTLERIRGDYISAFARYNNVSSGTAKPAKRHWINAMLAWVDTLPDFSSVCLPPVLDDETDLFRLSTDEVPRKSEYDVFTRDILHIVRQDIEAASVPSWIEKPPAQFGSASHGKLKADQWRTVCIIHLVMTLGRIWGDSSATNEERTVLDNFLQLVMAVDLATRRSMSPSRITRYDNHMENYIKTLVHTLKHPLVPNHHLSLHLWQCLELFGPVQGWWAFPFEQYNGLLQKVRTNNKPNEMPLTFMRFFYIGCAVRWEMSTSQWPAEPSYYKDMMSAYNEAFKDVTRGTRMTDMLAISSSGADDTHVYDATKHQSLSVDIYHHVLRIVRSYSQVPFQSAYAAHSPNGIFLPTSGQFVSSVTRAGLKYTSAQTSVRDSLITFVDPSTSTVRAAQIEDIFYHRRLEAGNVVVEPFLIVRGYSPLSGEHLQHDPFRKYEDLNTTLCYHTLEDSTCLIRMQDVVAHFAALVYTPPDIGEECIIVRSLDRVSASRPACPTQH
ncbi:hypothetical protein L226DRAFT_467294 [Lentinus tigrinus ALCF2SS1-7]|uniref:DUF4218 domain-containing protein n=1 Tax=Lentinus tigrinus ALCF2SS1-6 TaxID=1328759 RepID=A0A5C2S9Z7_9APHY|nr:hypothetical protein L227DRAFT_505790 [Lentinus tigrinus ALCF2SS1-6]RPD72177.1 hypothetical protein L226DRAFT_467294 [Lentinus tigrinus ALCF2SS1-7]